MEKLLVEQLARIRHSQMAIQNVLKKYGSRMTADEKERAKQTLKNYDTLVKDIEEMRKED